MRFFRLLERNAAQTTTTTTTTSLRKRKVDDKRYARFLDYGVSCRHAFSRVRLFSVPFLFFWGVDVFFVKNGFFLKKEKKKLVSFDHTHTLTHLLYTYTHTHTHRFEREKKLATNDDDFERASEASRWTTGRWRRVLRERDDDVAVWTSSSSFFMFDGEDDFLFLGNTNDPSGEG